jgi:hypothetical protein
MIKLIADVVHATNSPNWTKTDHVFTVQQETYGGGLYVNSLDFGCSRSYKTTDPHRALTMFLQEHACSPRNVREVSK